MKREFQGLNCFLPREHTIGGGEDELKGEFVAAALYICFKVCYEN